MNEYVPTEEQQKGVDQGYEIMRIWRDLSGPPLPLFKVYVKERFSIPIETRKLTLAKFLELNSEQRCQCCKDEGGVCTWNCLLSFAFQDFLAEQIAEFSKDLLNLPDVWGINTADPDGLICGRTDVMVGTLDNDYQWSDHAAPCMNLTVAQFFCTGL